MSKLTNIETAMNEIQPKQTMAETIQAKIDAAITAKEQAQVAATAAYESGDIQAYTEAITKADAAGDLATAYTKQLKQTKTESKITASEYQEFLNQIMTELGTLTTMAETSVAPLINQIKAISDDLKQQIEFGNSLIFRLQHDLYRDSIEHKYPDGHRVEMRHLHKVYQNTLPSLIEKKIKGDN